MARPVVLIVDDDPGVRESFRLTLEDHYDVVDVPDGPAALDVVRASQVDLVLLDIRLPEMDGIEVLERIKAIDDGVEVVLVTAVKTVRTAVAAMKLGAFDYLTKPFEEDELLTVIGRALEKRSLEREVTFLRSERARTQDTDEIVGRHPSMLKLHRLIAQVARTTATVLITGMYTHLNSPHRFTLPQLNACVLLMFDLRLSYRDPEEWLLASAQICKGLQLAVI